MKSQTERILTFHVSRLLVCPLCSAENSSAAAGYLSAITPPTAEPTAA
ncbi:MAG: hypothetical protein KF893_12845 [Caldilineaceae bacterium]|nr:hypothetical protein [Caldilineaceae bacterium]